MRKKGATKTLFNRKALKAMFEIMKTSGKPFSLVFTNYTRKIISETKTVHHVERFLPVQTFAAGQVVRREIKDLPKPNIKKHELKYFNHDFRFDSLEETVFNIDLKSAYATVLLRDKFITEETFNRLSKLPKLDRLAAVGMLASKKIVIDFDERGEICSYRNEVSEYENFFYYCVKRVGEIMNDLKKLAGNDYLFTWVDGIYIKPNADTLPDLLSYLDEIGFKYSVDVLNRFRVDHTNKKIKIEFWKHDENKGFPLSKKKFFQIPAASSSFAAEVANYITNIKITNNDYQTQVNRKSVN